jgi:hypothetical protein
MASSGQLIHVLGQHSDLLAESHLRKARRPLVGDTMARRADRGKIRVEYMRVLSLPRLRVYEP